MVVVTVSGRFVFSLARLWPAGLALIEPAELVKHIVLVAEKGMLPLLHGLSI